MTDGIELERGLRELAELARAVSVACHESIADYAMRALATIEAGRKILFCGNGGSAADAQHWPPSTSSVSRVTGEPCRHWR